VKSAIIPVVLPQHHHSREHGGDHRRLDQQPRPGPLEGQLRPEDAGISVHGDPRTVLPAHPELRTVDAEQELRRAGGESPRPGMKPAVVRRQRPGRAAASQRHYGNAHPAGLPPPRQRDGLACLGLDDIVDTLRILLDLPERALARLLHVQCRLVPAMHLRIERLPEDPGRSAAERRVQDPGVREVQRMLRRVPAREAVVQGRDIPGRTKTTLCNAAAMMNTWPSLWP